MGGGFSSGHRWGILGGHPGNDLFNEKKAAVVNKFTEEFIKDFCCEGQIDWKKLVQFNSGNLISLTKKPKKKKESLKAI
jgi:hypothetical protein